jgi:Glycosyltransferase family 28 C-terminal domain
MTASSLGHAERTAPGLPPVLLATSNGTGQGHLTRQLVVALGLSGLADPAIFSLSTAFPVISKLGLRGEYCPSYDRNWVPRSRWHSYLRDRFLALVRETGTHMVVFDGVVPYLGLLHARTALPEVAFVWVRRGMWKPNSSTSALRSRPFFDLVIEPGDLAASADEGPTAPLTDSVRVPPVTLQEFMPALSRTDAARALGLDPSMPTALVTLSSGRLNDVRAAGAGAVRALLANPGWQVAVTRSHVANDEIPLIDPARVVPLGEVYPLARYLRAFDVAVSAAGYNAFHELLLAGVPTVFVPNRSSTTDDQIARARWAAGQGLALVADELDADDVTAQVSRLCDQVERKEIAVACAALPAPTGGSVTADTLARLIGGFIAHRPTMRERATVAWFATKAAAADALGPSVTSVIRRVLRRPAQVGRGRRLAVELANPASGGSTPIDMKDRPWTPAMLTERIDAETMRSPYVIEHLITGASEEYRRSRMKIIRRYYRLKKRGGAT